VKKEAGETGHRFDVDFDIPEHSCRGSCGIYLTRDPTLRLSPGNKGQIATIITVFNGHPESQTNWKAFGGAATPFAQQQFNQTADSRSEIQVLGVACP